MTQDIYGRDITVTTAAGVDTWAVGADITIDVPAGTDAAVVMARIAGMPPDGWHPPVQPPVVPAAVTNYQIRAELLSRPAPPEVPVVDTLFDLVDAWATAKSDLAQQAWLHAGEVTRDGELVTACAAAFAFSADDLDGLFIAAAQRTA